MIDSHIDCFLKYDNLHVSKTFIICADEQLFNNFLLITGLKSINKCGLACSVYNLKYGQVSSFETSMGINYKNQIVSICWTSKSGKIYQLHEEVDCWDIKFWLEGVDVPLVYKQLYGPTALPFKIPATHYELIVGSISIVLDISILLKREFTSEISNIKTELGSFIAGFNAKSEKKGRKDGIIHNWNIIRNGFSLIVELDLGSAGAGFLKKFLKWLNMFQYIEKVEVGNTPPNYK